MKYVPFILVLFFSLFASCKEGEEVPETSPFIEISSKSIQFVRLATNQSFKVNTNIDDIKCEVTMGADWCSAIYADAELTITVAANNAYKSRIGSIALIGKDTKEVIAIVQEGKSTAIGQLGDDLKIKVKGATASSQQSGEEVEKSFDGSLSTIYHSPWAENEYMPVALIYDFENVETMDYLIYQPRTDGGTNGNFQEFDLYIATADNTELKLYGTYNFQGSSAASSISFSPALAKPTQIKFVVKSGKGGYASCAEMEFYRKNPDSFDYSELFTDATCSELKKGIDEAAINAVSNQFFKELAMEIFKGEYESEFRVQSYKSWQHPDVMAEKNKTNAYGLRDNPTGIYINAGEELVALAGDLHGQRVSLFVQDTQNTINGMSMSLSEGINKKKSTVSGLIYVMYYTPTGTEQPVKINVASGSVNGYFDSSKHAKEDWQRILGNATYKHFDVIGKYASLTFETEAFRKYTPDGLALIDKYDELVRLEQEFMGLPDYGKAYKNHAYFLAITDEDSHMYATDYFTAYNVNTQPDILDVRKFSSTACWGPAHELGHVHQTRPGLRWPGMTEVTNNIHSLYIQTSWGNTSRLLTDDCYAKAFSTLLKTGKAHNEIDDVWVKLVPFWQLKLYVMDVLGNKNFYKYIYEQLRLQPDADTQQVTDGCYQLNFVKLACKSAKLDLTEFFEAWGFLTPIDRTISDYGTAQFTITQQQIEQVKAEIALENYPIPKHFNIFVIRDDNLSDYK